MCEKERKRVSAIREPSSFFRDRGSEWSDVNTERSFLTMEWSDWNMTCLVETKKYDRRPVSL